MRALVSVYKKDGVVDFAKSLEASGFSIVSTGGTSTTLIDAGVKVTQVSELTSYPELLEGRVKTLHPKVHAAILAKTEDQSHLDQLKEHDIEPIQLVAVNLYPFVEAATQGNQTLDAMLELIDIGGSTLIRAAAKNFPRVVVVVDPSDYSWVAEKFAKKEQFTVDERKRLALKAFRHSSTYDAAVSNYLSNELRLGSQDQSFQFENEFTLPFKKQQDLRYGENPHQIAAMYANVPSAGGIASAEQLHGSPLSYNNILDADAALVCSKEFSECAAVIIKHTNPCGFALNENQTEAYQLALSGDPVSAYGGIVAFNRKLTKETADAMRGVFYEVIVAPDYEEEALEILKKRKNARVLRVPSVESNQVPLEVRAISGGVLIQTEDKTTDKDYPETWKLATSGSPATEEQLKDLAFAARVVKYIKSNGIVLVKNQSVIGIGCGQPNRLSSIHLAIRAAGDKSKGSVLASDAFMPFPDNVELAVTSGGVSAIVQPGGSIRDNESIEAANKHNIPMYFTGVRHFRH